MEHPTVIKYKTFHVEWMVKVAELANERVEAMVAEWKQRYPTKPLRIRFGNGTQYVTYTTRRGVTRALWEEYVCDERHNTLRAAPEAARRMVTDMLLDVNTITDYHTNGCPDDVDISR